MTKWLLVYILFDISEMKAQSFNTKLGCESAKELLIDYLDQTYAGKKLVTCLPYTPDRFEL